MFGAADSKIHLKFFDFEAFAFRKPAAFLNRVGESGEHALRRGGLLRSMTNALWETDRSAMFFFPFPPR